MDICFSILMPTYNQCAYIRRAILSLVQQTYDKWELIIINDGSTDETESIIADLIEKDRIKYIHNNKNTGLGHALNQGLAIAKYDYIAYLPSDDFFYSNHLSVLAAELENEHVILSYSGLRWDNNDSLHNNHEMESTNVRNGFSMQLVQVAHKKVNLKWVERQEWISDDLFSMYWNKLLPLGMFVATNIITCFWTSHPWQRHNIINEKYGGGINKVRSFYNIQEPIKIQVSREKFINEEILYSPFHSICKTTDNPLKILIVGELAYNPQRIFALEEAGHKLYGLWIPYPNLSFSTVGHLPFGHVEDISKDKWKEQIRDIKPDVIYALLNWGAVNLAYEVIREFPNIPFAWHYKEGPQIAMSMGIWDKLIYLYQHADLKIYINETTRKYYEQFITKGGLSMIMDGDLPKQEYFKVEFSPKLSEKDNEPHTICAGRLVGISENSLSILAANKIHIHLYLENYHFSRSKIIQHYKEKYPQYFHIHNHCSADNWTKEFSKYDAGWLHCIESHNGGDLIKATWDDLNIPARISTYAAAGIPIIIPSNNGNIVAMEKELEKRDIEISYKDFSHLSQQLKNRELVASKHQQMLRHRMTI